MKTTPLTRRALLGAASLATMPAWAAAPLPVVASFSILADFTRQVGGERVDVTALVGPDGDAHVFEPTPQQAGQLQRAQVLVSNGLGFEGWLPRLRKASGFKGLEVVATQGVGPRMLAAGQGHGHGHAHGDSQGHSHGHSHGDSPAHASGETPDPHAWQDVKNAVVYVRNIAQGLAQADPPNAAHYRARAAGYTRDLDALDARIRERLSALPTGRRSVVTTHDAFGYFAQAYGLRFVPARGLSTAAEPSARELARLVAQVRRERIGAIFLENIGDPRLLQQLARETGATVGGRLHSDALSRDGAAATYIGMMQANADTLFHALQGGITSASAA